MLSEMNGSIYTMVSKRIKSSKFSIKRLVKTFLFLEGYTSYVKPQIFIKQKIFAAPNTSSNKIP